MLIKSESLYLFGVLTQQDIIISIMTTCIHAMSLFKQQSKY